MPGNTEVVERLLRAFQEGDIEAALADLDPDVELLPIRAQLEGTRYRGHEGFRQVLTLFDEDWEYVRLLPQDLRGRGEFVYALLRVQSRGKASGVELDIPIGALWEFRWDQIVRLESFSEPDEALRAAGIED